MWIFFFQNFGLEKGKGKGVGEAEEGDDEDQDEEVEEEVMVERKRGKRHIFTQIKQDWRF